MSEKDNIPIEITLDDGNKAKQLRDLLEQKAKEKLKLESLPGLHLLKKSKFYYGNNGELRECIAVYNGYAIMIKQEKIKEDLNNKEVIMFPSIVILTDLKKMKKVNGNIIRKLNPDSIHEFEKMALLFKVTEEIDKGI